MNSIKKCNENMNSNKNKLNSKIIFIFYWYRKGRYKPFKSKNGFFVLGQIRALHRDMKINISNQTKNFNQKKKKGKWEIKVEN